MKVSYNWLKDYVDLSLPVAELAQALTARGVVVETVTSRNPGVAGVLVGRVMAISRHPNADSLWVCQVDVGEAAPMQILTGAQNVQQGDLVPAAVPGSTIPGMNLTVATLRGMESSGMLCSPAELGIDEGGESIMILPPEPGLEAGMDVAEYLGLNDWILELDLTANYASHCQSMTGVAQEVAAILGQSPYWPEGYTETEPNTEAGSMISVRIENPELCARYTARIVRGVKVGLSPAWMQARLRASGMRPINNIVDIANFVMLELGQPLHTFDYQKIRGQELIVRAALPGESITTLDSQERIMESDTLVIADRVGAVAMAGVMGGLESEVTETSTDILIESAAFDNINNRRTSLRMNLPSEAARRFTKGVDPSGCIRAADRCAQLIAALAGGRTVRGHVDLYPRPAVPPVLLLRTAKVNGHLGLALGTDRMEEDLSNLGMLVLSSAELALDLANGQPEADVEAGDDLSGRPVWTALHQISPVPRDASAYQGWAEAAWEAMQEAGDRLEGLDDTEVLVVVVPTRRLDIAAEIDLIEEIARAEGFDAIPAQLPVLATTRGGRSSLATKVLHARTALAGFGLDEVMTHSLTQPKVFDRLGLPAQSPLRQYLSVANPMYDDRAILRTTLLPGLLDTLAYNVNRQLKDLSLFEISHVYWPQAGQQLPSEPLLLGIALMGSQSTAGWQQRSRPADFFLLKGIVHQLLDLLNLPVWSVERSQSATLHPGRQAALIVDGQECGQFGELHPQVQQAWDLPDRVYVAEFQFDLLDAAALPLRSYHQVPRQPSVSRDVALVLPEDLPAQQVDQAIRSAGGDLLEAVSLFDLYQGEHVKPGYRSLAYRLTYRAADRTLTDADVEAVHGQVRRALQDLGADLRS